MATLGSVATGSAQMPAVTFDPARIVADDRAEEALHLGLVCRR